MAKLKVSSSSKPSSHSGNRSSKSGKPQTLLGRFNSTFFEGNGVLPSVGMGAMAALGMGGLYPAVNRFMPAMRQIAGSFWGSGKNKKNNKNNDGEDTGVVEGAIAKNRATEANRSIKTLTKVTKKGFSDVLKAMGAAPGEKKKKKTLWDMLMDGLGGALGGGKGGPSILPLGGKGLLGGLLRFVGLAAGSYFLGSSIRGALGISEGPNTGTRLSRIAGDTIAGKVSLNAGKAKYARTAQLLTRAKNINRIRKGGQAVAKTARLSMMGIRAASLGVATATSAYTFGLSLLIEEAVMHGIVGPLIDRYIWHQNQDKTLKVMNAISSGGPLTQTQKDTAIWLNAQAGGSMSWMSRQSNQAMDWFGYQFSKTATLTSPFTEKELETLTPEQKATYESFQQRLNAATSADEKVKIKNERGQYVQGIRRSWIGAKGKISNLGKEEAKKKILNPEKYGITNAQAFALAASTESGKTDEALRHSTEVLKTSQNLYNTASYISADKRLNKLLKGRKLEDLTDAGMEDVLYDYWGYQGNSVLRAKKANAVSEAKKILKKRYGPSGVDSGMLMLESEEFKNLPRDVQQAIFVSSLDRLNESYGTFSGTSYVAKAFQKAQANLGDEAFTQLLREANALTKNVSDKEMDKLFPEQVSKQLRAEKAFGKRGFTFGQTLNKDMSLVEEVNQAYNETTNGNAPSEEDKGTIEHRETTDLISASNQLDQHITELTAAITGKKVETINESGNDKNMSPVDASAAGSTVAASGPGALGQYLSKLDTLNINSSFANLSSKMDYNSLQV